MTATAPPISIPFMDLRREATDKGSKGLAISIRGAVNRVLRSGVFLYGSELESFEGEVAAWFGVKYAVGVASGTAALEVALRACELSGKTVPLPAMTCPPTINAAEAAGCAPVLLDMDATTRNTETKQTADGLAKTRAAGATPDRWDTQRLAVHLYGLASECDGVAVEDCAHAFGAKVNGKLAGTMGRAGALSFYPSKVIGADGDGGMVITNDKDVADRARQIRHYGYNDDKTDIALRGQNSRLSEVQAAVLRAKLPYVGSWIKVRQHQAAKYTAELKGRVTTPTIPDGCESSHCYYVVEHPERDRIADGLAARGIGCMKHYDKALHQYTRWSSLGAKGDFPNAERLAATCLSLPLYPYLKEREQAAVIAAIRDLT